MYEPISISELNRNIKVMLEENFKFVYLIGEISNCKVIKGNFYFTLKDESSQISAIMWSTSFGKLLFHPEDGMQIVIKGRLVVYHNRGTYNVEVFELKLEGQGEQQLRIERLKKKLFEEGLFDDIHKKEIPSFPENAALITSSTGAAIRDFIKTVKDRYPLLRLYIFPVAVQGINAVSQAITAIKDIQRFTKDNLLPVIDVIVLTRGGGSAEDLIHYNNENLARAVFNCKIPLISAIGHEIDWTICDLVADKRVSTPTAAAECLTPDKNDLIEKIAKFSYFCRNQVESFIENRLDSLEQIQKSYYFKRPADLLEKYSSSIDEMSKNIIYLTKDKLSYYQKCVSSYSDTLHHVDPNNNLKKGYVIISEAETKQVSLFKRKYVTRAAHVSKNDNVNIQFYDGQRSAKVVK